MFFVLQDKDDNAAERKTNRKDKTVFEWYDDKYHATSAAQLAP